MMGRRFLSLVFALFIVIGVACARSGGTQALKTSERLKVLVVETFLADITQNVAGDRLPVEALIPTGIDPHSFEPTPKEVARIAESQVLIINGAGFEEWLEETLANAGGQRLVIEASAGLTPIIRSTTESPTSGTVSSELCPASNQAEAQDQDGCITPSSQGESPHTQEGDPHFWLDPTKVIHYVENIRDGLSQVDPEGKDDYSKNAAAYIAELQALDAWITEQVAQLPPDKRLLVTNHESFGYFADRYGFEIIGAIIPSVSTLAMPTPAQIARLIDAIRATGVNAIFLETGSNSQLAEQIAREAGIKVISTLYTHSLSAPDGEAPTYIEMMKYNTRTIVESLR